MCIGADGNISAFDEAVVVLVEAERAADDGVEGEDVAEELENTRELSTTSGQHTHISAHGRDTFAITSQLRDIHTNENISQGYVQYQSSRS